MMKKLYLVLVILFVSSILLSTQKGAWDTSFNSETVSNWGYVHKDSNNVFTGVNTFEDTLKAETGRYATLTIAAYNSFPLSIFQADYVCDGTNDKVEIQQAIDESPNNGGHVHLCEGIFNASDIDLHGTGQDKNNIMFSGSGWATIIKLPDSTHENILKADGIDGLLITNLHIHGNWANQDTINWSVRYAGGGAPEELTNGIWIDNGNRVSVVNVYIDSVVNNGLSFHTGTIRSTVRGCYVKDCQWHGIEFWEGGKYSSIIGCYVQDCYANPITIEHTSAEFDKYVTISGCVLYNTTNNDSIEPLVGIMKNNYVTVTGNTFYNGGVRLNNSDWCTISGNVFGRDTLQDGVIRSVWLTNESDHNLVGNNTMFKGDMYVDNSSYNLIQNNVFVDGTRMVYLINVSIRNIIKDNIIKDFAGVPIFEFGVGPDSTEVFNNTFINCGGTVTFSGANSIRNKIRGDFSAESIESEYFFQELIQEASSKNAASGASAYTFAGFSVLSPDSFIIDSLLMVYSTTHNDVYIDKAEVYRGYTRTTLDATVIMTDDTNIGQGTATYIAYTYAVNQTVSHDWRIDIKFWVATLGVAGTGYLYSIKAYCHY